MRHAMRVGVGRVVRHQVAPRRVERLAMDRHRVGEIPGDRACLGVAERRAAMLHGDALDAARQVDLPVHRRNVVAAHLLDRGELVRRQVLVPAELLQHSHGELGVAVLDLRALVPRIDREQRLATALDTEAGTEGHAAFHRRLRRVVEQRRAGMLDLRRAVARPGQPVIVAVAWPAIGPSVVLSKVCWLAMWRRSRSGDCPV